MLSSIQQGGLVHVIDKTKGLKYKVGEVISKTEPTPEYGNASSLGMQSYFNLGVKIDGTTYEFKHINSTSNIVHYDNGNIIISETKEGLIPTVESIFHNSKQNLANREYYEQLVEDSEKVLQDLNPTFAKEKERDGKIAKLEEQVRGIDDKLDKIINSLNK